MILGSGLIQAADTWPKASDWLIRDEFTDTVAAGSVPGTAATPGPGTRAVTDTESKMSVGSGVLAIAGGKASPAVGDPAFTYGGHSFVAGLCLLSKNKIATGTTENSDVYINSSSLYVASPDAGWYYISDLSNVRLGSIALPGIARLSPGNYHEFAIVLRQTGALFLSRAHGETDYILEWVSTAPSWGATVYVSSINFSGERYVDYLRSIALPSPFDTDTGLATDTHSGAVSAGTTFVHEGNHILEYAATVPSGDNVDVAIRMQDADNYWFCRVNSSGDISLLEVIDGDTPVQRSTAAGVVSTGHRVVIIADGTTIKGYSNNTLRWTYASATNFATATDGKVLALGTGGAVSDLKTWPRTLGATAATTQAASILNKVSA